MAGDCTYNTHYANDDTFGTIKQSADGQHELVGDVNGDRTAQGSVSSPPSPYFEEIGGSLYRKKLERGFVQYREVLAEEQRLNAIATFHQKRPGKRHHTLEDTYRFVAEHYWWEGMYLQVREYVLGCEECKLRKTDRQELKDRCASRTMMSHSQEVLSKLKAQQEAGLFCDITLKTGGGHAFSAHKAVLAAVSEYFQEVFTEMDSAAVPQSYIDLTDFSEESFMPLLEYSYTSTLTLKLENLPEVSTMARHLRMWPALEACKAIQREHGSPGTVHRAGLPLSLAPGCPPPEVPNSRRTFSPFSQRTDAFQWKRKRELSSGGNDDDHHGGSIWNCAAQSKENNADGHFKLSLEDSDESEGECHQWPGLFQSQNRLHSSHPQPEENGFPCSPSRRLKLMDFKSPSIKRKLSTCSLSPASVSTHTSSPAAKRTSPRQPRAEGGQPARLLRSSPGAALALRRLLPKLDSSFKGKRRRIGSSFCSSTTSSASKSLSQRFSPPKTEAEADENQGAVLVTPVKVKQEPVEEEIQSARMQEEVLSPRTQEKYRLLSFLGLQRKSLLPGPDALIGWKQKNRLRKPKVNNYSLTARRKPKDPGSDLAPGAVGLPGGLRSSIGVMAGINPSFSLCDMTRVELLRRVIKAEPLELIRLEDMKLKRKKDVHSTPLLSTVKNTRSKVTLPPLLPTPSRCQEVRRPKEHRHAVREAPRAQGKPAEWPDRAPKRPIVKVKQEPVDCLVSTHPVNIPHIPHHNSSQLRQRAALPSRRTKKSVLKDSFVHTRSAVVTGRTQRYNSRCMVTQSRQRSTASSDNSVLQRGKVKRRLKEIREREESREWAHHHCLHQQSLYKAIKEEPADPLPLSVPLPDQEMPELGKRQSKLPMKLLDPGFLFSFCKPAAGIKREEESVDICLTRFVAHGNVPSSNPSHGNTRSNTRLRRRNLVDGRGSERPQRERQGVQSVQPSQRDTKALRRKVKKEPEERSVSQRVTKVRACPPATKKSSNAKREPPKNLGKLLPLHSRRSILLESIRRARLKQLRGPSAQAPRGSHACQQCRGSYRDCDTLIMHRIRHIEGKHWPCPLCSKTFFRQKNVKNHIRNHDPKLYKCHQCMASS